MMIRKKKKSAKNSQVHITLYTLIGNFERVRKALTEQFAKVTKEIIDSPESDMESFTIRLLEGTEIQININHNPVFIKQHISGMYGFFADVKCDNKKLHESVLAQIGVFNCVVGCSFELDSDQERTNYIIDAIFTAAKDVNGLVLMPDMSLFRGERKLVFSAEGNSDFEEYTPIGNTDFIDSGAEESPDDIARKERSFAILEEKGIPYLSHLRASVVESEAKLRSPEEIALRLFAMFGVCVYSETRNSGESWDETQKYLNKIDEILGGGLSSALSPEETEFLAIREPEPHDLGKFGWRYECCYVLLWALGMMELSYPSQICDAADLGGIIWRQNSLAEFLEKTYPRTKSEILDMADLILRYDWACMDARVNGQPSPAELDGEVVMEWHDAFNWLVG